MFKNLKIITLLLVSSLILPQASWAAKVLPEIQKTGVLKVGIRNDAAPFGFLDENGELQGYCLDIAKTLQQSLQQQLNLPEIELEIKQSTLDNRFEIVSNGTVHIECGPNSIRGNVEGINFSTPFFVTGTHFLTKAEAAEQFAYGNTLEGLTLGALSKTATENFINQEYPEAEVIFFEGEEGRTQGVQAVANGELDGFLSDGILLIGEVVKRNFDAGIFTLAPERPLTCDYYGMIVSDRDREWEQTINSFIEAEAAKQVWGNWFTTLFPYVLLNLEYCDGRIESQ